MYRFDPGTLRQLRKRHGKTMTDMAQLLSVSSAQIHRLENGHRRLTVDMAMRYCTALGTDITQLFQRNAEVPIIGIVDAKHQVHPLPEEAPKTTLAPHLVEDMANVAALKWEPSGAIEWMFGHLLLFHQHDEGVPQRAWGERCLIIRRDHTRCVGWPVKVGGVTHIDSVDGQAEFDTEIIWASPLLAVVSPYLTNSLVTTTGTDAAL